MVAGTFPAILRSAPLFVMRAFGVPRPIPIGRPARASKIALLSPSLFKTIIGGACPTARASVVLRAPWLFDFGCVGTASASHNIRLRRSLLVLLDEPFWSTPEESLTAWFARIELPEEFHARIDHNSDIVDFTCSKQRIQRGGCNRGDF